MQKKFQSSREDNGAGIRLYGMNREKQGLNNTDISGTKQSICARRFPKGERKAIWWGDGAKHHIPKCLDIYSLKCSV